ncbi:hypothetical protein Psuf_032250 [Phytohabitans suffuscus]|uniref:Uncharacterized protein n=1 Tax=Phytohabitans suffuscus TaxID=624315 RepID=A0A6F8YII1_9ACTN|nr:hypothetical protein Psuf_032250 [Phytohabitans suffuscus]
MLAVAKATLAEAARNERYPARAHQTLNEPVADLAAGPSRSSPAARVLAATREPD